MAQKTNSFERFWKELKRRKVVHVITVYAAVSFVILQLVDIVERPLRLPDWTTALVIVLLCIGFIIAVFVSWIYDITPAGVKKTKPVSELKHIDHTSHEVSSGWKIATYVSAIVVVALVAFNIVTRRNTNKDSIGSEKSIAVLPFMLLSDEPDKQYLADGMMEAITLHLSKIKGLRVIGRTSVEQYRNPTKTTTAIGRELDVKYLLEGSFQKFGDNVRLIVQLIKTGKEGHIWANNYDRNWSDIFAVQSEVAQAVAAELYASITQEEKKLIEKIPTSDTAAYELYLRANNYQKEYQKTRDTSSYQNAVVFYRAALQIDPSYAKAYTGLASAYYDRYHWETYFKKNYLDSMRVLIDRALSIDDQLDEAFYIRGRYYDENGQFQKAQEDYNKALKINPNYYSAYVAKGGTWSSTDFIKSIENYHEALNLIRGNERPSILRDLGQSYMCVGFMDKAKYYFQEAFALDGDSAEHFRRLALIESSNDNYKNAILFGEKANNTNIEWYSIEGQHQEAYMAAQKEIKQLKISGELPLVYSHRIGYSFWKVGKFNEADCYFKDQIKFGTESIKMGRGIVGLKAAQYDLAATYAFLGDKVKAYQYLDEFNTMNIYPLWWVSLAKHDPLFDKIRNEERFQKILRNMESKYQAEHERVRKWLEEQGML